MKEIKHTNNVSYWLKTNGIAIIEQCNYLESIVFHAWSRKTELFETPTRSTVAIWTVKKKVV